MKKNVVLRIEAIDGKGINVYVTDDLVKACGALISAVTRLCKKINELEPGAGDMTIEILAARFGYTVEKNGGRYERA